MTKTVATWIGIAIAMLGIIGTAMHSAADYGALEQRVSRVERDRAQDSVELKTIRLIVTRMCAVTPGCKE